MQVKVKLIGAFRTDRFKENIAEYPDGTRVEEIFSQLQIPKRALGTVLLNGLHARLDDVLNEGDTLTLLPILGGG
ncbi:MAG: MoaD/ThiS family protein [Deltaproteobacteria bacterium]|nr:MoaD/ThiS family protein [Deltaproteobacteria bacterium]